MPDSGKSDGGGTGQSSSLFSRRSVIGTVGAGVALLAGCSSDGGSGDSGATATTETTSSGSPVEPESPTPTPGGEVTPSEVGEAVEPVFDLGVFATPTQDWDVSAYNHTVGPMDTPLYVTRTPFGANAGNPELEYEPLLMAENELIDGTVWRNKIAEGFTWHTGNPVTIKDRYGKVKYDNLRQRKLGKEPTFDSVEMVDDRTMEITLHNEKHPVTFLSSKRPQVQRRYSTFEPHLEAMKDATSGREAFLVQDEFKNQSMSAEEWVGHGMFKIADIGENRVIYERYEDYPEPYDSYQNIEKLRLPIRSGNTSQQLLLKDGKTDWIYGADTVTRPIVRQSDMDYRIPEKKTTKQYAYRLNHVNKHLKRRGVRRAIAYVMRWGDISDEFPGLYVDKIQDGTTPYIGKTWMPNYSERTGEYIKYGAREKIARAEEELQSEGYERNSEGTWVGPEGDKLTANVSEPGWFSPISRTVVSWLTKFGFVSQLDEPDVFWKAYDNYQSGWDMIVSFHSRGANHPASSFKNDTGWGIKMSKQKDGETVPAGNRALEYELPTELGATDLSGQTETIYVPDLQATVSDPDATAEELAEAFETLTWWWNFHVPEYVAWGAVFNYIGEFENFEWLDWNGDGKGDAVNNYELSYSLHAGYLRGKTN